MSTYDEIKQSILSVIQEHMQGGGSLQTGGIASDVNNRLLHLGVNDTSIQIVFTVLGDLFRIGYLAWGHNIPNANPPFFHVTELGRKAIANQSRDPSNVDGYISHLANIGNVNQSADSYIREALRTFTADCPKACAVMVGCAAEGLALELRDAIVNRLKKTEKSIPNALSDWRAKTVLDETYRLLDTAKNRMPNELRELFSAHWSSFVHQIRMARNEAGHPSSLTPITIGTVHASLLIFPELLKLQRALIAWVDVDY